VVEEGGADGMKVTVCELPDDRRAFASEWSRLAKHVRREGSDVVLLPEMPFSRWIFAGPNFDRSVWDEAVLEHRKWIRRLPELGAPSVVGSRPVSKDARRFNEGFVWSRDRGVRGIHIKSYLPNDPGYFEASWYHRGGRRFIPFGVAGWKGGFMICSELWSMSDAISYGKHGVDLVLVPRTTGDESLDKWLAGGRVAAVVSGTYCVSSNRTGSRGEAHFGGMGWILDPDGGVLGLTTRSRPFVTVDLDRARAKEAKGTFPRYSLNRV
jgi:predicted amidohydrolase